MLLKKWVHRFMSPNLPDGNKFAASGRLLCPSAHCAISKDSYMFPACGMFNF